MRLHCPLSMWRWTQKFLAAFLPAVLLVLYLVVISCMLNRWDSLVAITLIPLWAWAGVGMILSLLTWLAFRGIPSLVLFCLWLATGIAFSEETHSLFRELARTIDPKTESPEKRIYRVVNVNAFGKSDALEQIGGLEPDLVMIQDAPSEADLRERAESWFGSEFDLVADGSLAILSRGEFLAVITEEESIAIHARVQIRDGLLIDATSVELAPCLPSPALWKPSTWEDLFKIRVANRRSLRTHLGENRITQPGIGRVVSGGFQTPPGDDVFRPLESNEMADAFAVSGEGWGNTYPSDYSVLRLDQIWVSANLTVHRARAVPNRFSDHRIVVADLVLPAQ